MLSLLSFFDALTAPIPASSQGKRFTSSFYYSAAENLPDFRALRLISATTMRAPRSCALLLLPAVAAWRRTHAPPPVARRRFVEGAVAALAATTTARSNAYSGQDKTTPKAKNLPPKELAKRVEKDLVENQCGPGAVDGLALPPRRRRREDPSQVPRDGEFRQNFVRRGLHVSRRN